MIDNLRNYKKSPEPAPDIRNTLPETMEELEVQKAQVEGTKEDWAFYFGILGFLVNTGCFLYCLSSENITYILMSGNASLAALAYVLKCIESRVKIT